MSEGEQFLDAEAQAAAEAEAEAAAAREREEADEDESRPIADAAIDLAAGARYTATGKRKTAVARVIIKPGSGTYQINGKTLEEFFPRETLTRIIRQPLETGRLRVADGRHRPDARGGVSAQAGALRHGISRALIVADPNLRWRAQAPRVPDPRPAGQGTQEGRAQEGPQAAPVLQALSRHGAPVIRHGRCPWPGGPLPHGRAGAQAGPHGGDAHRGATGLRS